VSFVINVPLSFKTQENMKLSYSRENARRRLFSCLSYG